MIGFDQPVFAEVVAAYVPPGSWPSAKGQLLCRVTIQTDASNHGMFQSRSKSRLRAMKITARIILLERGSADGDAVDFDFRPLGHAIDSESLSVGGSRRKQHRKCQKVPNRGTGAHRVTSKERF